VWRRPRRQYDVALSRGDVLVRLRAVFAEDADFKDFQIRVALANPGQRIMESVSFRRVIAFAWGHWRKFPHVLAALFFFRIVMTVAEVFLPIYAGRIIDALSLPEDNGNRVQIAMSAFAIMVGLGFIVRVVYQIGIRVWIWLAANIMEKIVQDAYYRVQRFSTDWHENSFAGATVRKITRGMWAFDLFGDMLYFGLGPALLIVIGMTIMLATFWPAMGMLIAGILLIYIIMSAILATYYVAPANKVAVEQDSALGAKLADALSCNTVVKAFAAEPREEATFATVIGDWRQKTTRSWVRHENMGAAQAVLLIAMQASLIGLALNFWANGEATPGNIVLVITSYFVINGYLRDIGFHIRNLQQAANDMEDIIEFEDHPLDVADRPDANTLVAEKGGIEFDDVTFRYNNQPTALYENFSLRIKPGERIGLVGESGSGKSTFVKLIQRLYDVNEGVIVIDRQDISVVTQESLRRAISIVPQEPILFHRSLAENISYCRPGATRAEIELAAKQARAHEFILRMPEKYETLVGERGVKLSGGERQRVALARAFLADAPILVLDEATSSLDSVTEGSIQDAIRELIKDRTTILIAHRLSTVRDVDRILVFSKGRIVEQGSHAELIGREDGEYFRLVQSQREALA
jgi:ATP-binding cassette subfamily B protein